MKCNKCGNTDIPKVEGKFICKNKIPVKNKKGEIIRYEICYNEMIISYSPTVGCNYNEHMRKQKERRFKRQAKKM